ncbi:HAD-like domain-containing protein [Apodospora peruviana]|uniref:Mitochondrial import inner membrane translocase subunit TIM50 n=1 Tax=Apodospora peruviana TaxID=516989 RepID=A0AAE0II18_9PEZI|nr:HAD-like domain-containing protein [Apodospora peruviana]
MNLSTSSPAAAQQKAEKLKKQLTNHNKIPTKFQRKSQFKVPSKGSGGVPEPTPAYLLRASFLARTVPEPRPILVVIDLNGTILFRPRRDEPSVFIERPHARQFLEYCTSTFHVVIWSSAQPANVRAMYKQLFSEDQEKNAVIAVWARDKFGLTKEDYKERTMCYKRLTRLWKDKNIQAARPLPNEVWDQGNTVLIDDTVEKARSEPFNAITVPEFKGDINEQPDVLPLVHDYLNTLAHQADISTYIRTSPFKITADGGDGGGASVANAMADVPITTGTAAASELIDLTADN